MKRSERILVLLNPASGVVSKDIAISFIFKKLRDHFQTVSLVNTTSPRHAAEIIAQAIAQFDVITAFGGDGTVNSVAAELVHTDKVLGILPGGSGNGLVRNLNIPLSWRRALDTLIYGKDVHIDSGLINDRFFVNVAGIGLDGLIAKKYNLESKARGMLPYVYYVLQGFHEMPFCRVRIQTEELEFESEVSFLTVANFKQWGGNAIIAPQASPYDELLDLCVLDRFKLLKTSLNLPRLFTGNIDKFPFYKSFKIARVRIHSLGGPVPFQFDGEYGGGELSDFDIRVVPASLKVRIPATRK